MDDESVMHRMTEPILRVAPDENPGDLAEGMIDLGIKSVIVTDGDDHPEGIITSTDYLRMAAAGVDPHETTVGEWMTDDVITIRADEGIQRAAEVMREHDVNHLPIVDGAGQAVGILSATDVTARVADED